MADESPAFPEESRAPGRWLDRAAAEHLLSGAPLEDLESLRTGHDARTAAEAARLARVLHALRTLAAGEAAAHAGASTGEHGAGDAHRAGGEDRTGETQRPAGVHPTGLHLAGTPRPSASAAPRTRPGAAGGPDAGAAPGELAALAAFRQARDEQWGRDEGAGVRQAVLGGGRSADGARAARSSDAARSGATGATGATGTVELESPVRLGGESGVPYARAARATRADRARRPMRFSLVAAVAACLLGGVTVAAATTGILPSPFGGTHRPSPTVSVSEADTPARPPLAPSPRVSGSADDVPGTPTASGGATGAPPDGDDARPHHSDSGKPSDPESSENWWPRMVSACQDYRGGKELDDDTARALEDAAQGAGRVEHFCDSLLGGGNDLHGNSGQAQGSTGDSGGTSTNDSSESPEAPSTEPADGGTGGGASNSDGAGGVGSDPSPSTSETAPVPSATAEVATGVTFSGPTAQ